ncbi:hypothetical protein PP753_gp41 [Dinoroseobacter phage vB_DshP-R7L]|uniref:Uncharacterized protein n=1 Tax=Dinoroseobacter phage vB_DshP-R7L TaxID=2873349 RepID=A0AAE8XD53_9CAUD|nr:hypothetical protein PP753_gp41 [Dinoroseobacter phage vB_DshP-R7L]UAT28917.1 hypothetical protein R7L_gp78 [Dinoroseobacter phage vB_DshP-R7L]
MDIRQIPTPKVIRAEKSANKNVDDAKVIVMGIIFCTVIVIIQGLFYSESSEETNPETVTIEVTQ